MSHEVVPCTVEVYRLDCPESLTSLVFQRPVVSYLYRAGRPVEGETKTFSEEVFSFIRSSSNFFEKRLRIRKFSIMGRRQTIRNKLRSSERALQTDLTDTLQLSA